MKFHEEEPYNIKSYYFMKAARRNCGIYNAKELNQLETMFLQAIDYRLVVDPLEVSNYEALLSQKAQAIQNKHFKISLSDYVLVEDHFSPKHVEKVERENSQNYKCSKLPPVFLNGRLFSSQEEVYSFFHCDEICEESTQYSGECSFDSFFDESPRFH
jgi:hypothetical protein